MVFYSGQKVVCVDAKERMNGPSLLVEGQVYTILDPARSVNGVTIVEVDPFPCPAFHADRFRPIVDKQTDISVFKVKELEDV